MPETHDLAAQVRQLTSDVAVLNDQLKDANLQNRRVEMSRNELIDVNNALANRLANTEQRLEESEKALTELKRVDEFNQAQHRGTPGCYSDDHHTHSSDGFCLAGDESVTVSVPGLPDRHVQVAVAVLEAFAAGYREYGEGAADALGIAGQWGDLHRKVMKLKSTMWSGKPNLTRETPQEVLQDIVGHALLALEMYGRDFKGGRDA